MKLGLEGKHALVLGAGGGLGGQVALDLAAEGCRVTATDRSPDALQSAVQLAQKQELTLFPVVADLSGSRELAALHDAAVQHHGPVDVLFNNSGGPAPAGALEITEQSWRDSFDAMVLSLIELTGLVVPAMRRRGWGRIITSTSSGVIAPISGLAASNALRSALVGWSKTLAGEVGQVGITVNVVVPGRIETSRVRSLDEARAIREGATADEVQRRSAAVIPAGRYGTPEEYSAAVVFLASQRASFITGTQVRVDGGMIPSV